MRTGSDDGGALQTHDDAGECLRRDDGPTGLSDKDWGSLRWRVPFASGGGGDADGRSRVTRSWAMSDGGGG